jgi:cell division protease FtsH
MSEALGPVYWEHQTEHPFLGQRLATDERASETTIASIEKEARAMLVRAHESATAILSSRRLKLVQLVDALLERETLEASDLADLFGDSRTERIEAPGAPTEAAAWA